MGFSVRGAGRSSSVETFRVTSVEWEFGRLIHGTLFGARRSPTSAHAWRLQGQWETELASSTRAVSRGLLAHGYRKRGSVGDAEDVVHKAYAPGVVTVLVLAVLDEFTIRTDISRTLSGQRRAASIRRGNV
jgi:hypothetical protein